MPYDTLDMFKEYHEVLFIPWDLIDREEGLGSEGRSKVLISENPPMFDNDDLRITINLVSGQKVLIEPDTRLVVTENGVLVEGLR